jgi:hypothetical protein
MCLIAACGFLAPHIHALSLLLLFQVQLHLDAELQTVGSVVMGQSLQ